MPLKTTYVSATTAMKITVIIPAYNEGTYLPQVLDKILSVSMAPHELWQVIVSNDASTDNTHEVLRQYAHRHKCITVISGARNRGKTAAIREAIPLATGDVVIIQDADLEYDPGDYARLIAPISAGDATVVYGSRFLSTRRPAGMRPVYLLANRIFTWLANSLYNGKLTDEGTAYKVFRTEVLRAIPIRSSRFGFCPEVTGFLLKAGIPIKEVPIAYSARTRKEGKKPGFPDGLEIIWTLVKNRFIR